MRSETRTINIVGKSTNELYSVSLPSNLLGFCSYDFTLFMERSVDLCRRCMKSGEYPIDEIAQIRNAISSCHKYVENNIRGTFDRIVVDCWIEYICRQNEIGTATLWNSFMACENPFQEAVFMRLSEYRRHQSINQWVNLLKMQEYANKKLDYVFGCRLENLSEAISRLNTFDLMFSVAANEQGYSLDAIGATRVFKAGRLPNAPFVLGGAAREMARNVFKDVKYAENLPYASVHESAMSDWEAMDAFSVIKGHLPEYNDTVVNTIVKSMMKLPATVYLPSGFKAMIDLEIDALLDSGAFLQRCKRCKEFYVRDDNYSSEYCDRVRRDGTTCLEIMDAPRGTPPTGEQMRVFREKSDEIYKEMSERVGETITQRDFSDWNSYFTGIKNHVMRGDVTMSDFDAFLDYSRSFSFTTLRAETPEEPAPLPVSEKKEAKPYQFQRVDRKTLERQGLLSRHDPEIEAEPEPISPPPPPARVSQRIIRGAQPTSFYEIPIDNPREDKPAASSPEVLAQEALMAFGEDISKPNKAIQKKNIKPSVQKANTFVGEDFGTPRNDEDVKIYEFKGEEIRDPELDVKIFERSKQPEKTASSYEKPVYSAKASPEKAVPAAEKPASSVEEQQALPRTKTTVERPISNPAFTYVIPAENELETLAEAVPKPEMNRAAKVVSAYKTVAEPTEPSEPTEPERPTIDFSRILNSIERNDGFEDVPVDSDGVPLSHKTKHVMDAIMRSSKVSPSLGLGRHAPDPNNEEYD